jgi:hypothetical protein
MGFMLVRHSLNAGIHLFSFKMDVIKAIQHYADKMINDVPGMKALLLDTETVMLYMSLTLIYLHYLPLFFNLDAHHFTCHYAINIANQRMLSN